MQSLLLPSRGIALPTVASIRGGKRALTVLFPAHKALPRVASAAQLRSSVLAASALEPSNAETAKTVASLVGHGTLSTVGADGFPVSVYAQFTLDETGHPLLLVDREIASGTKCSLFIQAPSLPARRIARLSLLGSLEPAEASEKVLSRLAERREAFGAESSDAKHVLYRLTVAQCQLSKGLASNAAVLPVQGEEFAKAEVDVLATCASALAAQMNEEREEDLMRLAGPSLGVSFDAIQGAEMLWVDQYGVTVRVWLDHGVREARVAFLRTVRDERDARSLITMMAQAAWEADKQYAPAFPEALLDTSNN